MFTFVPENKAGLKNFYVLLTVNKKLLPKLSKILSKN